MQYDSAMIHLLRYRDRTPPDLKGEGYRNIVNLIGDIYYRAGLYHKAREVYTSLLELYEAEHEWDFYRPYVMMNNLGQIGYKTGDLKLAGEWYSRSLNLAEKYLQTSYRYNTIGYTKIKMAEVALAQDSLDAAGRLLKEVTEYPEGSIYEDVRQEYLYARARLLLKLGKPDEAEALANVLQPGDSLRFGAYRFVPEIYRLFADVYTIKQDYFQALQYENKYRMMQDSLKDQEHLAASMIIFADYNHELTRIELRRSEHRLLFAATGLVVVFSILLITLVFYRKLYRSKLELVRKSMEEEPSSKMLAPENSDFTRNGSIGDDEAKKQKELIRALKAIMEKQQPYLDPGLTIVDMARQLNTNRTYLSKAINNQLETTFPNFINQLRIKESIRLIISGYTKDKTQEALSKQSGFANRNVFISAFKKYTGVLPSFFIANYKKWDQQKNRFNDDE
jgi:AraC-like DNA-binding protein